ncbi:PREDICTED: uncharacterized protein LOC105448540 [Wasmannia auropunctata]|uniref:uncharacterized protein LOC105448540 n=1 Tax=Wasmannia auropunctata TaxID=64793 RepID=UPI0005EFD86B|nr:PREDICTED: uncharacterized protein LOC105448540 [Wasmannia auropunctata]
MREVGLGIKNMIERMEAERKGRERNWGRSWWDGDCREKKRIVRKALRRWKREVGEGREYRREKREYKELCELKKWEENERWEKKVKEAKTEGQVWRIVGGERKRKTRINESIRMADWEEYFRGVLRGVESRVVKGEERTEREVEERELGKEKISRVLGKIRDGKAMRVDGIPGEVWKYGGEETEDWVRWCCNEIWKGERWPEG